MMKLEKFKSLSETYGANLKRWPENYQQEVSALSIEDFAAEDFAKLNTLLNEAAILDATLASHHITPANRTLFDSIIASAPKPHTSLWQQLTTLLGIRFASLGLANLGLASLGLASLGFTSLVAGVFCFSLWISAIQVDGAENVGAVAEYIDFGNEWISS